MMDSIDWLICIRNFFTSFNEAQFSSNCCWFNESWWIERFLMLPISSNWCPSFVKTALPMARCKTGSVAEKLGLRSTENDVSNNGKWHRMVTGNDRGEVTLIVTENEMPLSWSNCSMVLLSKYLANSIKGLSSINIEAKYFWSKTSWFSIVWYAWSAWK